MNQRSNASQKAGLSHTDEPAHSAIKNERPGQSAASRAARRTLALQNLLDLIAANDDEPLRLNPRPVMRVTQAALQRRTTQVRLHNLIIMELYGTPLSTESEMRRVLAKGASQASTSPGPSPSP